MNKKKRTFGFTLVEVIVALAVFGIVSIAFINLFTFALVNVYRAGDKSESVQLVQEDLEGQIARNESSGNLSFEIKFNDANKFTITGGNLSSNKTNGQSQSVVNAFVPNVPTVSVSPFSVIEGGAKSVSITITGIKTNFIVNNTTLEIWDKTFTQNLLIPKKATVTSPTSLTFAIDSDDIKLLNTYGDYILRVVTTDVSGKKEIARTKLTVLEPSMVAVGAGQVYTSQKGDYWLNRSGVASPTFPVFGELLDITYGQDKYIAIETNGKMLKSTDFNNWYAEQPIFGQTLNAISWDELKGKFYVVTQNGNILESSDAISWSTTYTDVIPLKNIYTSESGSSIAVGDAIITNNGMNWNKKPVVPSATLNSIYSRDIYDGALMSWSTTFLAVGNNGLLMRSSDGVNWTTSPIVVSGATIMNNLNDITYHNGKWLIVGDSGTLLSSTDGTNWSTIVKTANHLNAVIATTTDQFMIAGDNGTLLYSAPNTFNFSLVTGLPVNNINAIAEIN